MPGPGGYWLMPLLIAAIAASSTSLGPSVSGNPWPRLTLPVDMASALISAKMVVPNPWSLAVRYGRRSDTSVSVGGSSYLKLSEVLGTERVRQQFLQREGGPHSVRPGGVDRCVALRKLAQTLPASAAARSDCFPVADRQYRDDLAFSSGDHGRDCPGLGT